MHQRPDQSASQPDLADSKASQHVAGDDVGVEQVDQTVSAARQPANDATVKKATRGLMRLQSRRRTRVLLRRLFLVLVIAGSLAGIGYLLADQIPTDQLKNRWENISARLFPDESASTP